MSKSIEIPTNIQEYLQYNPTTGDLEWLKPVAKKIKKGSKVTCINSKTGYGVVRLHNINYQVHRVAWFLQTGKPPTTHIDHIDGNRANNKWNNLREATHSQNQHNKKLQVNNTTGYKGVYLKNDGKYYTQIRVKGKRITLGTFVDILDAYAAYCNASEKYHGEFGNTG